VVQRYYTPVSRFEQKVKEFKISRFYKCSFKGSFDLLIKIYQANVHPEFPNGGPLTQYLEKMKVSFAK